MPLPKLSKLERQIMDAFWKRGPCSVREIQESFPAKKRQACWRRYRPQGPAPRTARAPAPLFERAEASRILVDRAREVLAHKRGSRAAGLHPALGVNIGRHQFAGGSGDKNAAKAEQCLRRTGHPTPPPLPSRRGIAASARGRALRVSIPLATRECPLRATQRPE